MILGSLDCQHSRRARHRLALHGHDRHLLRVIRRRLCNSHELGFELNVVPTVR